MQIILTLIIIYALTVCILLAAWIYFVGELNEAKKKEQNIYQTNTDNNNDPR